MKPLLRSICALSLLITAMTLPGCKTAGQVVIYTSVDMVYSKPVFEKFEKETGIKVKPVYDIEAQKTTGLANRLRTEKGRPQADLFWNGEFANTLALCDEGVLKDYTAFGGRARVLLINTEKMPDESKYPTTLRELLSESYDQSRIGIANPLFGTTAAHAAALYAVWGDAEGKAFFQAIKDNSWRILEGNGAVRDKVVSGEIDMGLTDTDDAFSAVQGGKKVKMVFLDQDGSGIGTLILPNTVAYTSKADNSENAKKLYDYIIGIQNQKALYESGWFDIIDDPGAVETPRFDFSGIRNMAVSLTEIAEKFEVSKNDLTALFMQ